MQPGDLSEPARAAVALTRLVEIVSKAANRVSNVTLQAQADIPWPQIIGMRNRLAHGYDVID
jgi:uncharacterized protein with HEPN domain